MRCLLKVEVHDQGLEAANYEVDIKIIEEIPAQVVVNLVSELLKMVATTPLSKTEE